MTYLTGAHVPSPALTYIMAESTQSPVGSPITKSKSRPSISIRSATAPNYMAVNGHFASQGQNGHANFEHGVQVIDEDKEFKYVLKTLSFRRTH